MVDISTFGTTPAGDEVHAYTLTAGEVSVRVMDFGATLLGAKVPDRAGDAADIVLGFGALDGYLNNPACYGCTVGPSANRSDRAEVPLGDTVCQLPKNDGPALANNLHTDLANGLHKRMWRAAVDESGQAVTFTHELEDGVFGLPGNRTFTARYELSAPEGADAQLTVTYGCTTDAQTFVNMTNHTYFNLAGHASGSALAQTVRVNAGHFLPLRADNISMGEVRPVDGTPFDFREAKPLGRDIDAADDQLAGARGYDHCLCVERRAPSGAARRGRRLRARARHLHHHAGRAPLHGQLARRSRCKGRGRIRTPPRLRVRARVLSRRHAPQRMAAPRLHPRAAVPLRHRLSLLPPLNPTGAAPERTAPHRTAATPAIADSKERNLP